MAGSPDQITKFTPGPWRWFGNVVHNSLYLATTHSGRRYVMSFKRWGFSGAQPQFQPAGRGLVDASQLLQFEVGDRDVVGVEAACSNGSVYRMDIRGIDCPDAHLIAAAPELFGALWELAAEIDSEIDQRKHGGNAEDWADLQDKSDRARAAIAKALGNPTP